MITLNEYDVDLMKERALAMRAEAARFRAARRLRPASKGDASPGTGWVAALRSLVGRRVRTA